MKQYYTGLIIDSNYKQKTKSACKGRGWEIYFEPLLRRKDWEKGSREVVIYACSKNTAIKVLKLVLASLTLIEGFPVTLYDDHFLIPLTRDEMNLKGQKDIDILTRSTFTTLTIPLACFLAAKASYKTKWVYAIAKYFYSLSNYTLDDLEPHRSRYYGITKNPFYHIKMVYSILSAFSVIEELGLEIRASADNPSRRNGIWNPIVKENLEKRLIESNVDIKEPMIWLIRGPDRRLEQKRSVVVKQKTDWAKYNVKDSEVEIIEAISFADWLRSKVVAHKVHKGLTDILKPYDVVNVQLLSRRLILESIGYWKESP